jgi:hypothetical protein
MKCCPMEKYDSPILLHQCNIGVWHLILGSLYVIVKLWARLDNSLGGDGKFLDNSP